MFEEQFEGSERETLRAELKHPAYLNAVEGLEAVPPRRSQKSKMLSVV